MKIENKSEKIKAIRVAEDCIHSVLSVNPKAVDMQVFVTLNALKMDLLDLIDEETFEEIN
jgi:hypothetical protein